MISKSLPVETPARVTTDPKFQIAPPEISSAHAIRTRRITITRRAGCGWQSVSISCQFRRRSSGKIFVVSLWPLWTTVATANTVTTMPSLSWRGAPNCTSCEMRTELRSVPVGMAIYRCGVAWLAADSGKARKRMRRKTR